MPNLSAYESKAKGWATSHLVLVAAIAAALGLIAGAVLF